MNNKTMTAYPLRLLAALLVLCCLFGAALPLSAHAEGGEGAPAKTGKLTVEATRRTGVYAQGLWR